MKRFATLGPALLLGLITLLSPRVPGIAGDVALYPALGVFPGMTAALLLGWRWSRGRRWLLGLTLAPLVSAGAGFGLASAGLPLAAAARDIAIAGFAMWLALEALRAWRGVGLAEEGEPLPPLVARWSLGLAAAIALPPLFNPFIRVHGDGWVHAGMAWEIALRGAPPQDPRFAGLPINYVWFYNLWVALLTALRGPRFDPPFVYMAALNVVGAALITRFAYRLGYAVWRNSRAAAGAALLLTLGFNAGTLVLWPLRFAAAFTGAVRGMDEVRRILAHTYPFDDRVFFMLGMPFAYEVSFLDKFLLGNPISYAWLLTLLLLDALLEWVREPRLELLAWGALAAGGLLLFHFVPGLSVIPVLLGALVLAMLLRRRWPWLPAPGRLAGFGAATLFGAALIHPYTASILRGWSHTGVPESHFHIGIRMAWTLLSSCGVALAFAWRPLRRLIPERRAEGALLVCYLAGMTLFALVVHLTENNEHKFAFQTFVPLAIVGGPAFLPALQGWFARWGAPRTIALLIALFGGPLVMLNGYLVDPRWRTAPELTSAPGEEAMYAWMRDSTAARAVFVDARYRDLILVRGRRRLYYGSTFGPEHAGFPLAQVTERRAVMADLYGPGERLEADGRSLAALGQPAYVVFRPDDFGGATPRESLGRRADLFRLAYEDSGFRIYALRR